jgi:hypothetical protein
LERPNTDLSIPAISSLAEGDIAFDDFRRSKFISRDVFRNYACIKYGLFRSDEAAAIVPGKVIYLLKG